MTKYKVSIDFEIEVEADDYDEAITKMWKEFERLNLDDELVRCEEIENEN